MAKQPKRSSSRGRARETRSDRATQKAKRRASLEPALPLDPAIEIDPDAPADVIDPDTLEALHDTQSVVDDVQPETGAVGPDARDRQRGTVLTGGDVDAAWDDGAVGEETVGGSTPTPDQDVVDDLGRAVGVTYSDTEPLRPEAKEAARDDDRWELHPASSEDYAERLRSLRRRAKQPPRE